MARSLGEHGLFLHRGNRVELLVDALAESLEIPVGGPLDPEWVVVPGHGMAGWLATELATRFGVWTGADVLYPRALLERVIERVLGADRAGGVGAYSQERLTWATIACLPDLVGRPELARLRGYLEDDASGARLADLARAIAAMLDAYLSYRPDWLLAWERGDDARAVELGEPWQPVLWRALVARLGRNHLASLEEPLLAAIEAGGSVGALPPRLSVFGVAALPPLDVRTLVALGRHHAVHIYLLSPTPSWWSDLASPRDRARAAAAGRSPDALHLDACHPLLASLGHVGADFQRLLAREIEALGPPEIARDHFAPAETSSLLGRLQADLAAVGRAPRPGDGGAATDGSIRLLSCHGPRREVEALHDALLDLLTDGGSLRPHDVVVMTPDLETYAPLVEAVFGRERPDDRFLPYHVADRPLRADAAVIDAFFRVLALVGGRAAAADVVDLLRLEPVRRRFAISLEDLDTIIGWVVDAGVRWGIDADHRASVGQPAQHEGTWRFGLDRLLVGYALPSGGRELFAGVLSFDEVEGQEAAIAGKLAEACERLFGALRALAAPRTLGAWRDALLEALAALTVADGEAAWQHQSLQRALDALCADADAAGLRGPVAFAVVRDALERSLDASHAERGFLRGGVTVCAMVPMRSIPFRVVCLLGLGDGAFPRHDRPLDFDLITKDGARRFGDRRRRDDDRYLFLEALLSARERLLITYPGQSVRDDARLSPSVVVSELCEALVAAEMPQALAELFHLDEQGRLDRALPGLCVKHPLQPFSPRYFDGAGASAGLFSYAREYAEAITVRRAGTHPRPPLFGQSPIAPPDADALERPVALAELLRFFRDPVAYLMRRRLGVALEAAEPDVPEREPLELDDLWEWRLGDRLLERRLEGIRGAELSLLGRAGGELPPGAIGASALAQVIERVEAVARETLRLRAGAGRGRERVEHAYARPSGARQLATWLRHLAHAAEHDDAGPTTLVCRDASGRGATTVRFAPPTRARAATELAKLVALYRRGLCEPLCLLPGPSLGYAERLRSPRGNALAAARRELDKLSHLRHWRLAFGDADVLASGPPPEGHGFAELACAVFDPLLDHRSLGQAPGEEAD
jgi:exodeoxyribonuclease V gamma subunit